MSRLLAAVLFLTATIVFAQPRQPVPSPYAIRDQIANAEDFDLRGLYRALALPGEFQEAGERPNTKLNCMGRACTASVQEMDERAGADRPTHVLSICWSYSSMCRFVFFHENRRAKVWSVIRNLDESHNGGMLSPSSGNPFRLGYITTTGTGAHYSFERWFDVSSSAIVPVHEVLLRGNDANVQPVRLFQAFLVSEKSTDTEDILTYVFYVEFESGSFEPMFIDLFDEHRTVRYVRPKGHGRYQFDPARSEMTAAEMSAYFKVSDAKPFALDPPPSKLLAFARKSLRRIARSGSAAQKEWLTNYLAAAPASAIKTELTRALAAK
ncbi:MAG: hypothetical protein ABI972_30090 [Acidobacteriota bacterium]